MREIKYAIFDVDGTLLDSMYAWDDVAERFLIGLGATPKDGLREDMRSIGGHQLPAYFRDNYGIERTSEEIRLAVNGLLSDFYRNEALPKPGVAKLLETLHRQGAKMCVATASDRELISPALERCGLMRYFSRIFTCREEGTGKDRPDIYVRAAHHLGGRVAETHVFEDALYAVKTAKHAGFIVTAIYDESSADEWAETSAVADYSCRSFEDWE